MLESDEPQQYRRTPQGPMLDPREQALRNAPAIPRPVLQLD
jgi:hypothetical protein